MLINIHIYIASAKVVWKYLESLKKIHKHFREKKKNIFIFDQNIDVFNTKSQYYSKELLFKGGKPTYNFFCKVLRSHVFSLSM